MSIKRINIKDFREFGFLQELNRQFLHPLGMALEVIINYETGEETLGGIWDYREDPDGICFNEIDDGRKVKIERVKEFMDIKRKQRQKTLNYIIQE